MNKYTLKFQDKKQEQAFQLHRTQNLQFNLFILLNFMAIILIIINVGTNFKDQENTTMNFIKIGIVIILIIQNIVIVRSKIHTNTGLLVLGFAISIIEFSLRSDFDAYDGYLFGTNQMTSHLILMFLSSFASSLTQCILLTGFRIYVVYYQSGPLEITQYLYTISLSLASLIILYKIEQVQRNLYLLSVKENSIKNILDSVMKEPYVIFYIDPFSMKFKPISMRIKDLFGDWAFDEFLLKLKSRQHTLKDILYEYYKQYKKIGQVKFKHKMKLKIETEDYHATFYAFNFESQLFAITFQQLDKDQNKINQQLKQNMYKFYRNITNQCYKLLNTQSSGQNNNKDLILKNQFSLLQGYLLSKSEKFKKIKKIPLSKFIQKMAVVLKRDKYLIQYFCKKKIFIKTSEQLIILLEIFKYFDKTRKIYITCTQDDLSTFAVIVKGLNQIPNSSLFMKYQKFILQSIEQNEMGVTFKFFTTPIDSFY